MYTREFIGIECPVQVCPAAQSDHHLLILVVRETGATLSYGTLIKYLLQPLFISCKVLFFSLYSYYLRLYE